MASNTLAENTSIKEKSIKKGAQVLWNTSETRSILSIVNHF